MPPFSLSFTDQYVQKRMLQHFFLLFDGFWWKNGQSKNDLHQKNFPFILTRSKFDIVFSWLSFFYYFFLCVLYYTVLLLFRPPYIFVWFNPVTCNVGLFIKYYFFLLFLLLFFVETSLSNPRIWPMFRLFGQNKTHLS